MVDEQVMVGKRSGLTRRQTLAEQLKDRWPICTSGATVDICRGKAMGGLDQCANKLENTRASSPAVRRDICDRANDAVVIEWWGGGRAVVRGHGLGLRVREDVEAAGAVRVRCACNVTRHTSHVTRHTSHVTRHTPRHTSPVSRITPALHIP